MKGKVIFVVEDEPIIAEDLCDTLRDLGYQVPKYVGQSAKAIDYLSHHTVDLVLCDISIEGARDGIEVAEVVRKRRDVPFVFLTSFSDRSTLERAKHVEPFGYIVKPFTEADLLSGIEIALHRHAISQNQFMISKEKMDRHLSEELTDREFEILLAIKDGLSNDQIVQTKFISLNTVKSHIRNIFSKMQVQNRVGAMKKIMKILSS